MRENKLTFWDLKDELEDLLDDEAKENNNVIMNEDMWNICDSIIPLYNSDLLDVCASDLSIGYPDEILEHKDVYSMISWSIYESLQMHGDSHCKDNNYEIKY